MLQREASCIAVPNAKRSFSTASSHTPMFFLNICSHHSFQHSVDSFRGVDFRVVQKGEGEFTFIIFYQLP